MARVSMLVALSSLFFPKPSRLACIHFLRRCGLAIWAGLMLALVPGCETRSRVMEDTVAIRAQFSSTASLGEQPEAVEAPREAWWRAFESESLNQLIPAALHGNLTLRQAFERLRAAEAVVAREAGDFLPSLDANATGQLREPDDGRGEELSLGLSAAYEVDLWGRIAAAVRAERFRSMVSRFDYEAAALSLSGEVARTWFRLVESEARRRLLEAQLSRNEEVLNLLEARLGAGQVRGVDVLRQRELVESRRGDVLEAEARSAVLANQLATLLGRPPTGAFVQTWLGGNGEPQSLSVPEELPATGLPAELIQRRPDTRAALARVRVADEEIAVALAQRYPRLDLSASLTTANGGSDQLFQDWLGTVAGRLLAPLFAGGSRSAEIERTEAVARGTLYAYGQTVLEAFREVEDALVQARKQRELLASLQRQEALAQRSYEQLRTEYLNGVIDYIDVLTALIDLQQVQRDILAARLALIEFRIDLYLALAGGFSEVPPPETT
jgi:NodT family efflux transporter outer membrane factor (OMF) lipoprotein